MTELETILQPKYVSHIISNI